MSRRGIATAGNSHPWRTFAGKLSNAGPFNPLKILAPRVGVRLSLYDKHLVKVGTADLAKARGGFLGGSPHHVAVTAADARRRRSATCSWDESGEFCKGLLLNDLCVGTQIEFPWQKRTNPSIVERIARSTTSGMPSCVTRSCGSRTGKSSQTDPAAIWDSASRRFLSHQLKGPQNGTL